MKRYRVGCFLLVVILLSGCASPFYAKKSANLTQEETTQGEQVQEQVQDMNYEVPRSTPNVLVDQVGYETKCNKMVLFKGENLSDSFEIVDGESGEIVYTGTIISKGFDENTKEYHSYGNFTELDKNGTYYIQTPIIGQSYPFIIGDNIYENLFRQSNQQFYEKKNNLTLILDNSSKRYEKKCAQEILIASNRLLAYELYPNAYTDNMGIPESKNEIPDVLDEVKYEIQWLLMMQQESGGVYSGVSGMKDNIGALQNMDMTQVELKAVTPEATADFAALMAQFYLLYAPYDLEYGRTCLKAAENAWNYLGTLDAKVIQKDKYYAAAELYKATGAAKYHTVIKSYFSTTGKDSPCDFNEELYGDIAYLSTTRAVDITICSALMAKWMNKAEEISQEARGNSLFVSSADNKEILENMLCLSVADYVIMNHEYSTVLENHLHYLLGCNSQGISYVESEGYVFPSDLEEQQVVTQQPSTAVLFQFMLAEIISKDITKDEDIKK